MTNESTIVSLISRLESEISKVRGDLPTLDVLPNKDLVDQHLLDRLTVALQNAHGCVHLAKAELPIPLLTVTRSLFESLIATYWASLSTANSRTIVESGSREITRLFRNLAQRGRVIVHDQTTGQDVTTEVMGSDIVAEARRPPRFDQMATDAGIRNVYDAMYGMLSMFAHGTATEVLAHMGQPGALAAALPAATAVLGAIHLIASRHIRLNQQVPRDELAELLNVQLSV